MTTSTRMILPKSEKAEKKRVAAYCRVSSSSEEQLHSCAAQVKFHTEMLTADETCEFVGVYADEGISGTSVKKRFQFMKMIEDCRAGKIDAVITKSVSRFGRNTVDTLVYTRELKILGIDIYFEKENLHSTSPDGELMLTLMAAFAESESESMSENIKWGLREAYKKGQAESLPLGKFYGYKQENRTISIIEEEAKVIRRIYDEYLMGLNSAEIAGKLTAEGIPTERGNSVWHETVIRKILRNEKYMGDSLFQKSFIVNPLSHQRKKNKGELTQYFATDSFPPIVDRTVWNLVHVEEQRRTEYCREHGLTHYANSSEQSPFSSRIVCGVCGNTYQMLTSKQRDNYGKIYWRCTSFHGNKGTPSFPNTVSWEHPYPHNNSLKADMGILNADNSINSLVEF
ncbi:MAG TPA: recombinase family protein [Oscillospiraceae bacterium]|nr:recombinase family protein [Oscillospiraceae bacterium]HRW57017.1 recombinase family protein [Oscillospiraceae bacterium]